MLDIKFLRTNPDIVKQNIKNKFQDEKLPLVDKVIELDKEFRESKTRAEALRANRNKVSKQIGALMGQGKKEEAEEIKKQVTDIAEELEALTVKETHRVLDKAFLAGFTELILMRLEVCPQSFVILRTASRTADRIYVKLNIF